MLKETKKPWQSIGIMGGGFAFVAMLLKQFGVVDISEVDQQKIADMLLRLVEIGGVLAAMVGRWIATKEIKL